MVRIRGNSEMCPSSKCLIWQKKKMDTSLLLPPIGKYQGPQCYLAFDGTQKNVSTEFRTEEKST